MIIIHIGTLNGPTSGTYTFNAGQHVGQIQVLGYFEPQDPSGANNETAYEGNALADIVEVKLKKSLKDIGEEKKFISGETLKIEYEFNGGPPPNSVYDWEVVKNQTSNIMKTGDPKDVSVKKTQKSIEFEPSHSGNSTAGSGKPKGLEYKLKFKLYGEVKKEFVIKQDETNTVRQEYYYLSEPIKPERTEFKNSSSYSNPGHFPFSQVNSGYYDVIIFKIASNLESVRSTLGSSMPVNSGYRNPIKQKRLSPTATYKAHIRGEAADIGVRDFNGDGRINANTVNDPSWGQVGDDWYILANAARQNSASFIEPYSKTGTWVHMDWR